MATWMKQGVKKDSMASEQKLLFHFLISTDLQVGWVSLFWFDFLNVFHCCSEDCQISVENDREEIDSGGSGR